MAMESVNTGSMRSLSALFDSRADADRAVVHAVVELARTHADAFRTATRALDDDARTRLQQTFRTAIGAPAAPTAAPSGEGRIALRTFGAAEWRSS